MSTAYFFGAGASKADNFPITRELLCALAAWLRPTRQSVGQGKELFTFLKSAFDVSNEDLCAAARQWKLHCTAVTGRELETIPTTPANLPNLTDILSMLDILLADEGGFGLETATSRALKASGLRKAREQVATAIAYGFNELHVQLRKRQAAPLLIDRFIDRDVIGRGDVLITTNWDILLDRSRDYSFGSTAGDYGTEAALKGTAPRDEQRQRQRPKLFKLHGSLNWLCCPRCSWLRIDVPTVTAHDGYDPRSRNKRTRCETCKMPCEAVLVTPTFLKSYRNRHLLNIWAEAQQALADSNKWVFIGYSLPDDDIHIKSLLLKAKRMHIDKFHRAPQIQVVTHNPDNALQERYQRLFGKAVVFEPSKGGFAAYVGQRTKDAAKDASKRERRKVAKEREAVRRTEKRKRAKLKRK